MDYESYRQKLANSGQTGEQWHREADSWFDGSVESIDCRLAACNLLLARSQEALARDTGNHKHLAAVSDLRASQRHLEGLREDLLTASQDKSAFTESQVHGLIHGSHADRRWVALEGARFYRANDDVNTEELLIRARNHAELKTSTRSAPDSRAITSAFVQKVAALAEGVPKRQVRVATAPRPDTRPDEVLFM